MEYHDLIDIKKDVGIYQVRFLLWKDQWDSYADLSVELNWKCVKFEKDNVDQIPTAKGIYALFVEPRIAQFPSHGYLMYIGQSGYESNHNLRERFKDYLYERKRVKRVHINYLLNTWEDHIYFYYAEVDPNEANLLELERKLLDTFIPPYTHRGFSVKISTIRKILEL